MTSSTIDASGAPSLEAALSSSGVGVQCVAGFLIQVGHRLLAIVVFLLVAGFVLGLVNKSPAITRWVVPGAGLVADLAILISLVVRLLELDPQQRDEGREITIAGAVMLAISIIWVLLA